MTLLKEAKYHNKVLDNHIIIWTVTNFKILSIVHRKNKIIIYNNIIINNINYNKNKNKIN